MWVKDGQFHRILPNLHFTSESYLSGICCLGGRGWPLGWLTVERANTGFSVASTITWWAGPLVPCWVSYCRSSSLMPDTVVWELYSESEESEPLFAWPGGTANRTTLGGGSGEGVGSRFSPLAGDTYLRRFQVKSVITHLPASHTWSAKLSIVQGSLHPSPDCPYPTRYPSPTLPPRGPSGLTAGAKELPSAFKLWKGRLRPFSFYSSLDSHLEWKMLHGYKTTRLRPPISWFKKKTKTQLVLHSPNY